MKNEMTRVTVGFFFKVINSFWKPIFYFFFFNIFLEQKEIQ